ncbi:MAG: SDR family oxidoreductase [Gammaproteobacteria bacterium]|nr:SDR family oxidoreductase [Gammaproteobacteria bacterium]
MKVLITGSNGFIGKNLIARIKEKPSINVVKFSREDTEEDLAKLVNDVDLVIHLAGVNRPEHDDLFLKDNLKLTTSLCDLLKSKGNKVPIIFSSSTQATLDNPYGKSKLMSEEVINRYSTETNSIAYIYRLPNVFGKWSKPSYNSVVSTFCHNVINGKKLEVHNLNTELNLVYIDDLVDEFISIIDQKKSIDSGPQYPVYQIHLSDLANLIKSFKLSRNNITIEKVGVGLVRALYATYLSFLSPENFSYELQVHSDERGKFGEFLKTKDSGQISYFTIKPGFTRGEHYHHTKNEKFLLVKGSAKFRFRNILNNEIFIKSVTEKYAEVIESIPGWVHDVTNTGKDEAIIMLWANEIFNEALPDTYFTRIES